MTEEKYLQPLLIIPKIIEQPTWGGKYILKEKGWSHKPPFRGLRIGQSYELYSQSKVRVDLNTSTDDFRSLGSGGSEYQYFRYSKGGIR